MKHLHFLLYLIALAVVFIPIALKEAGNPLTKPLETVVLALGLLILIAGKMVSIKRKRANGERTQLDFIFIAILGIIILWMMSQTLFF